MFIFTFTSLTLNSSKILYLISNYHNPHNANYMEIFDLKKEEQYTTKNTTAFAHFLNTH